MMRNKLSPILKTYVSVIVPNYALVFNFMPIDLYLLSTGKNHSTFRYAPRPSAFRT
jgi:hypothetical protein